MWQVYGQEHILRQLDAGLKTGRVGHAYLLVGPPRVGKMTLAVNMAQAVNCLAGPGTARRMPSPAPPDAPRPAGPADSLFALPEAAQPSEAASLSPTAEPTAAPSGAPPCGQCGQCRRIAKGSHADVQVVGVSSEEGGPARRDIRIDQVRELEAFLNLTPYEGACKVVIIDGAELLNTAAANALLKTLEEPPAESLLLLLTANEDALLPTIRSRCSLLYLKTVARAELVEQLRQRYAADPATAELLARLSRGCPGQAALALQDSRLLEQREADLARLLEVCQGGLDARFDYAADLAGRFSRERDAVRELLYLWLRWWRDLLLIKEGAEEYLHNADRLTPLKLQATGLTTSQVTAFIKRINRTLEALDANANPRLALETLMLGLPGKALRQ